MRKKPRNEAVMEAVLPTAPAVTKTIEAWAAVKSTRLSTFLAAKKFNKWPEGRMLSETQYDQGVLATKRHKIL